MFTFATKHEIRHLHVVVGSDSSEMYKKSVMHVQAKLLFCFSKPVAFLTFSLPSPSWLLKLPNTLFLYKKTEKVIVLTGVVRGQQSQVVENQCRP